MKAFSNEWIAALNARHTGGVFFRAAIVQLSQDVTGYFADVTDPIIFDGQTYTPLPMVWDGVGQNSQRSLPRLSITVPNVDGQIGAFLETASVIGNDVTLQLLHLDLLADVSNVDAATLQIVAVEWTDSQATFTLGLNLALTENLPRHVVTRGIFPGTPDTFRRASIL